MKLAKYIAAVAAISMTAAPVFAAPANPASSLSLSKSARAGAPAGASNKAAGLGGGWIIGAVAAAAIVAGIIIIADDDDDDNSDSN